MNRLLLLPGYYRYHPRVDPGWGVDGSVELTVPVYIVSQERGLSLVVLREDAPRLRLVSLGGGDWPARAGVYFEAEDSQCIADLDAVGREMPMAVSG